MLLKVTIRALLAAFFVCSVAAQTNAPAERLRRSAEAKITRGDNDGAISDLTKAIELKPDDLGDIYLTRAGLFREKSDYAKAWDDATKALPLLRSPAAAYRFRGDVSLLRKNWAAAVTEYTKAVELYPEDTMSFVNRAVARVELGDKTAAIADLTAAIATAPASFLYIRRADVHRGKGDNASAYKDLNKAVELDEQSATPYVERGRNFYLDKMYPAAMADFEKALRLNPNSADAYHFLGHVHYDQGQLGPAIEAFTGAIKLDPNGGYYLDRALAYRDQLDFDRAESDLAAGVKKAPDDANIQLAVAYMHLLRGSGGAAFTVAEEFLAKHRAKGNGQYMIAVAYLGYLSKNAPVDAKAFLRKWSASIEPATRGGKLLKFLNGQTTAAQLLAVATTPDERTEARAFIGAAAVLGGKAAVGKPHLSWVRTSGKKGSWAYMLGYVIYDRFFTGQANEPMG
jgi:tetratricopeptide (TPR) repeat protein